ncbi:hypothetical protein ACWDCC_17540 [Streptomyces sp. NPDC001102]
MAPGARGGRGTGQVGALRRVTEQRHSGHRVSPVPGRQRVQGAQDRRGVGDQRGERRRPAPSNSAATRAVAAAAIAGRNAVNVWTVLDAVTMTAPSSSPA